MSRNYVGASQNGVSLDQFSAPCGFVQQPYEKWGSPRPCDSSSVTFLQSMSIRLIVMSVISDNSGVWRIRAIVKHVVFCNGKKFDFAIVAHIGALLSYEGQTMLRNLDDVAYCYHACSRPFCRKGTACLSLGLCAATAGYAAKPLI